MLQVQRTKKIIIPHFSREGFFSTVTQGKAVEAVPRQQMLK